MSTTVPLLKYIVIILEDFKYASPQNVMYFSNSTFPVVKYVNFY